MGFLDIVAQLRRSTESLRDQHRKLTDELAALNAQRQAILTAPASKVEIKEMLTRWVHACGVRHRASLRSTLDRFIRAPHTMNIDQQVSRSLSVVAAFGEDRNAPSGADLDSAMCALFGAQLLDAMHSAVDAMEWNEGLPLAARPAATLKLDERIAKLNGELADLVEQSRAAGLSLE